METFQVDHYAEPVFGIQLSGGPFTLGVHDRAKCKGENCTIHNPSDHHMKDWPLNWRADARIMERMCPHDIGHPDPDGITDYPGHGCDGCCTKKGGTDGTGTQTPR